MDITPQAEARLAAYRAFLERLPDGQLSSVLLMIGDYLKSEAVVEGSETSRSSSDMTKESEGSKFQTYVLSRVAAQTKAECVD